MDKKLKISIVIPNYNLANYLERTIKSVIAQSYDHKEIIIVDGDSDDASREIIEQYRDDVDHVIVEPDEGHADALNKGFALSTGEIMGWINSDDVLLPGCLSTAVNIFEQFQQVNWIVGNSTHISDQDHLLSSYPPRPHSRIRFLMGDVRWVQQESTFWRRRLWNDAGGRLETKYQLAVDFELWARFFRHAALFGVHAGLGAFRMRAGQRSHSFLDDYLREVETIIHKERTLVPQDFYQQHIGLMQLPFMLRKKHETDVFGDSVTKHDLEPIRFDRETLQWVNPNAANIISLPLHSETQKPALKYSA